MHSIDVACCYRWSGVLCLCVCLSVGDDHEPCKNSRIASEPVCIVDLHGPEKPCVTRWGLDFLMGSWTFEVCLARQQAL